MKKTITLVLLFMSLSFISGAQVIADSTTMRAGAGGVQINMQFLPKRDQTVITPAEQTIITNYMLSLGKRILSFSFDSTTFYVEPETDMNVFDIMEGIKERGISLMYIKGHEMTFVNDDLKIETWSIK